VKEHIAHHFCAGTYAKEVRLPAGFLMVQHRHTYDHLSILAAGRVAVMCDQKMTTYDAPACINIRAGVNHHVHALTDAVWFCVHKTDETDPARVDETLIEKEDAACLHCG
jgi:quercetin dioxygenase-like cupin family protein